MDYVNGTQEFISQSEISTFLGTGTYDALPLEEKRYMEQMTAELTAEHQMKYMQDDSVAMPLDVDDGNYSFVNPNSYMYSGIVVVAVYDASGECDAVGTGFMIDSDNFLTALHVIFEDNEDTFAIYPTNELPEIRVFFDVDYDLTGDNLMETMSFTKERLQAMRESGILVTNGYYSPQVTVSNTDNDSPFDWFVGKLATPVTGVYYWNCVVPSTSYIGLSSYVAGYPREYALQKVETIGIVRDIDIDACFIEVSNMNDAGMSGGPVYIFSGSLKCCGINNFGTELNGAAYGSEGVAFDSTALNAITDFMNR